MPGGFAGSAAGPRRGRGRPTTFYMGGRTGSRRVVD